MKRKSLNIKLLASANSNIVSKSTSSKQASTNNSKGKISLPTTDARLYNNESEFAQSHTSGTVVFLIVY